MQTKHFHARESVLIYLNSRDEFSRLQSRELVHFEIHESSSCTDILQLWLLAREILGSLLSSVHRIAQLSTPVGLTMFMLRPRLSEYFSSSRFMFMLS